VGGRLAYREIAAPRTKLLSFDLDEQKVRTGALVQYSYPDDVDGDELTRLGGVNE
jgi:hypothetical protein